MTTKAKKKRQKGHQVTKVIRVHESTYNRLVNLQRGMNSLDDVISHMLDRIEEFHMEDYKHE